MFISLIIVHQNIKKNSFLFLKKENCFSLLLLITKTVAADADIGI